jgi:hypothetical protein
VQLQSQPLLAALSEEEREAIRESAPFTDTPSYASYVQSLGLTPSHLSLPVLVSIPTSSQETRPAASTPGKPAQATTAAAEEEKERLQEML